MTIKKETKRNKTIVVKDIDVDTHYTWFLTYKELLLIPPENTEYSIVNGKYSKLSKLHNVK